MIEEKADGEIHPLDKKWAFITKLFDPDITLENQSPLGECLREFSLKYAQYLFENDKELVMQILVKYAMPQRLNFSTPDTHTFILKPPQNPVGGKTAFSIKFKRAKSDNLDSK